MNDMRNPYLEVTNLVDAKRNFPDAERIAQLIDFIDGAQILFLLMCTWWSRTAPSFIREPGSFPQGRRRMSIG